MNKQILLFVASLLFLSSISAHTWCGHEAVIADALRDPLQREALTTRTTQRYLPSEAPGKGKQMSGMAEQGGIRISFHTETLLNDEPQRVCSAVGNMYKKGNPSSGTKLCSSVVTADCWAVCTANDIISEEATSAITNEFIPRLQEYFTSVLDVERISENLRLHAHVTVCGAEGGVQVPMTYRTDGVPETDLLIFVTMRPTAGSILAWATSCQLDQNNRPIAGQINISPSLIGSSTYSFASKLEVLKHEMFHVLAFSPILYPNYRDDSGNTRVNVVASGMRSFSGGSKQISYIATPKVLETVQEHFQCDSLAGAELEDGGDPSTTASHWEKRIFANELMTGNIEQVDVQVTSKLTFSLLEDSGWYKPNYERAERLLYGNGKGCQFAEGRCEEWGTYSDTQLSGYKCMEHGELECSHNHIGKGVCVIQQYDTPLDPYYQHLPDPTLGGSNALADYCPLVQFASNGDCRSASNENVNSKVWAEAYNNNSRCFHSDITEALYEISSYKLRCHETRCSSTTLYVRVANNWLRCPTAGGSVKAPFGYKGTIQCPPFDIICQSSMPPDEYSAAPQAMKATTNAVPKAVALSLATALLLLLLSL